MSRYWEHVQNPVTTKSKRLNISEDYLGKLSVYFSNYNIATHHSL
jgi:hypothetical protein